MKWTASALVLGLLLASGCSDGQDDAGTPEKKRPISKIKITASDELFYNGRKISLDDLPGELETLRRKKGSVWFHREYPENEASPFAMQVVRMIATAKLPIRLMKEDFE